MSNQKYGSLTFLILLAVVVYASANLLSFIGKSGVVQGIVTQVINLTEFGFILLLVMIVSIFSGKNDYSSTT